MVKEVINAETTLRCAPKQVAVSANPEGQGPALLPQCWLLCCPYSGQSVTTEVGLAQQRPYIGSGFVAPNAWMMDAAVERGTLLDVRNLV